MRRGNKQRPETVVETPSMTGKESGDAFERILIASFKVYEDKGLGIIRKVATPFRIVRTGYTMRTLPGEKSSVDFMGFYASWSRIIKAIPVAIEAKSCHSTSFSVSEVKPHQIRFMEKWEEQGGKAFVVVHMHELGQVYRIPFAIFMTFVNRAINGGRKSISLSEFQEMTPCLQMSATTFDVLDIIG
jgi:recombination protein U